MAMTTMPADAAIEQARCLVDCLRGMGFTATATLWGDDYLLCIAGPTDLSAELQASAAALKPELLVVLCEEDMARASRPARGGGA